MSTMPEFGYSVTCAMIAFAATVRADSGPGWPMRGGDPANSGISSNYGVKSGISAWTSPGGHPTVGADGTVYTTVAWAYEDRGELWALNPEDGSKRWTVRLTDAAGQYLECSSPPLIGPDGHIYLGWAFGYRDRAENDVTALLAFDGSGQLLWRFEPRYFGQYPGGAQPIWGPNATIIIPISVGFPNTERASLLAIDSRTGQLRWRFRHPRMDAPGRSPAIGNGRVYYETQGHFEPASLFCLNSLTGEVIWEVYPISGNNNSPTVETSTDGSEYVYLAGYRPDTGERAELTKIDSNGAVQWMYAAWPSYVAGSAAVHGGRVYLPVTNGLPDPPSNGLHVLDAETGALLNTIPVIYGTRAVALDRKGNMFFQNRSKMFGYSNAGDFLWEAAFYESSFTMMAIGRDGLILGSTGTRVYAYRSVLSRGDMDCDGTINLFDVQPFITALSDPQTYEAQYRFCSLDDPADVNNDGSVNLFDIQPFVALLTP